MDGHPRQNPAYRPATEKALVTGLFLWSRFAGDSTRFPVLTEAGLRLDSEAGRAIAEIERSYRRRLGPGRLEGLRAALDELRRP